MYILFFKLNLQNLACILCLQYISIQSSHNSSVAISYHIRHFISGDFIVIQDLIASFLSWKLPTGKTISHPARCSWYPLPSLASTASASPLETISSIASQTLICIRLTGNLIKQQILFQ